MNSVEQNLDNIRIIRESVDETPIHEIAEEVRKVSQLFLAQAKTHFASFEQYIKDFLRLVDIIRVITDNCFVLDRQIGLSSAFPWEINQRLRCHHLLPKLQTKVSCTWSWSAGYHFAVAWRIRTILSPVRNWR